KPPDSDERLSMEEQHTTPDFVRLAPRGCHPEPFDCVQDNRGEGSHDEILRCAVHEQIGRAHSLRYCGVYLKPVRWSCPSTSPPMAVTLRANGEKPHGTSLVALRGRPEPSNVSRG